MLTQLLVMAVAVVAWLCWAESARAINSIKFTSTQLPVAVGFIAGPQAIALVDVNKDGRADILAVNMDSDYVSVFLNDGNGNFNTSPDSIFVTGTTPAASLV